MKFETEITLLRHGGRKTPLSQSGFRCWLRLEDQNPPDGHSCVLHFDDISDWHPGETRPVDLEFLGWSEFPPGSQANFFELHEAKLIGTGKFLSSRS